MGNIQIKERPPRRGRIFNGKIKSQSRSPFREIITPTSPYYKAFSPIRYAQDNSNLNKSTFRESIRAVSPRTQLPESSRIEKSNRSARKEVEYNENRQKCQQIIKKVRNFNDFLLELKRKLKDDCCSQKEIKEDRGRVSMNVKLENEKVELEKYKQLVQRQLSKTHSIESIKVENLRDGEKMLTIEYQNKEETDNVAKQIDFLKNRQPKQSPPPSAFGFNFKKEQKIALKQEIQQMIPKQSKASIHDVKASFMILKQKCAALGVQLSRHETNQSEGKRDRQNTAKMKKLFQQLSSTNSYSMQLQRKIRSILL